MHFDYGCAKGLYTRCLHPRVLLGPEDVSRLKSRVRSGRARILMDGIRRRALPRLQSVLAGGDVADGLPFTHEIALMAVLDGNDDALEAARRILAGLPEAVLQHDVDILVHGRVSSAVFAYDLLYERLPEGPAGTFREWLLDTQVRKIIEKAKPGFYRRAGMNLAFGKILSAIHSVLATRGDAGVPPMDDVLDEMILCLHATINTALCPDGYPEEDMGYGTDFLALITLACVALRRAGVFDAFTRYARLRKAGTALVHFAQPWGRNLSATGDAGDHFGLREYGLPMLARVSGDPAVAWLFAQLRWAADEVSFGREFSVPATAVSLLMLDTIGRPRHPAAGARPTQFRDRRRGIVSLRSGWGADDTFVVFDGSQRSPGAQGHAHASCGHFSISALGEYFAIDTGRYNMDQDQHNVVLVDGKSGRPSEGQWRMAFQHGNLIDYVPGPFADYAAVDSSLQHDCYWARRHLGLVKGKGAPAYVWTVEDLNKANDLRQFWWTLNTSPANTIRIARDRATVVGSRRGNMLDVSVALPDPKSYTPPHTLEWAQDVMLCGSYKYLNGETRAAEYGDDQEAMLHYCAFRRPRLIAKVTGLNGRFLSVMVPRRRGERAAAVRRLPSIDNSLAVRITFPRVEDTLVFAYDHNLLEAGDVSGRGLWCVVRRSRATGRVVQWELGRGTELSVAGRTLKALADD